MKTQSQKFLALLIIIALTTLACSTLTSAGNGNSPSSSNDVNNSGNSNDSSEEGGGSGIFSGNPSTLNLDDLTLYSEITDSNYTVSMDFNITAEGADGSTIFRQILLAGERNMDPAGSFMRMTPNDPSVMDGIEFFEIASIENVDYVNIGGMGCSVFANDEFSNPYDTLADTGGFLTGEAERIGTDTVNDTKVDVYEITYENLDSTDQTTQDIQELDEGYLYLSYEGKIIGLYLTGTGKSDLLAGTNAVVGTVVYDLNFTPTSTQFDIQPPADCESTEDLSYPILGDAQMSASMPGIYSYTTETEFDLIVDFYKTEMAALNHTLNEEAIYAPTGTLSYTLAEGGKINIFISQNPTGAGFQVLIIEE